MEPNRLMEQNYYTIKVQFRIRNRTRCVNFTQAFEPGQFYRSKAHLSVEEHVGLLNAVILNLLIVAVVVLIHHEVLLRLSTATAKMRQSHRFRLILAVFGVLLAHTAQVWIFACAYYFMHHGDGWGALSGNFNGSLLDCVYFSFSTFTTLGYGDIEAFGNLRFLTGIEGLTGLVLITWSASFLFVEMQRYWPTR